MKYMWLLILFLYISVGLCGLMYSEEGFVSEEVADGFSFVSSASEDGKRWKVDGDRARFLLDGFIEIDGVKAVVFGKDEERYYLFTDQARINKNFTKILSDKFVRMVRGEAEITGVGLEWSAEKKVVIIKKNVTVIITSEEGKEFIK